jgi:hypothetical protein
VNLHKYKILWNPAVSRGLSTSLICVLNMSRICQVLYLDYLICLEFYFEVLLNVLEFYFKVLLNMLEFYFEVLLNMLEYVKSIMSRLPYMSRVLF